MQYNDRSPLENMSSSQGWRGGCIASMYFVQGFADCSTQESEIYRAAYIFMDSRKRCMKAAHHLSVRI